MEKQTILITGATGNVGGGAARELAKRGARIVLLGRSPDRLEARAESIRTALSEARIEFQFHDIDTCVVDFTDMESVRRAAAEIEDRFPKIHGLILSSVALIQQGPNILPNGHEVMFAANVMGPFLFTQLLFARLQQSNGLVLHVVAPFYAEIDWDDLESLKHHKTENAYNRTKTMDRMIAAESARRHAGKIAFVVIIAVFRVDIENTVTFCLAILHGSLVSQEKLTLLKPHQCSFSGSLAVTTGTGPGDEFGSRGCIRGPDSAAGDRILHVAIRRGKRHHRDEQNRYELRHETSPK